MTGHATFFDASTRLIGSRGSRDAVAVRPVIRRPAAAAAAGGATAASSEGSDESAFDRGVREIRRTDPRWDPARFAGYAAMVVRAAYRAWTTGDIASLRDRVTPAMHAELQARSERLRQSGRASRAEEPEITAEVIEAWQEDGRDYLTAYVTGSVVDYVVDAATGSVVAGSTIPRDVAEFWTFARPSGLNFWMLSAIQTG